MKQITLPFLLAFVLFGAGCLKTNGNVLLPPTGSESENKENLTGIVTVLVNEVKSDDQAPCPVNIKYPSIDHSQYSAANEKFNEQVATFIAHQLEVENPPRSDQEIQEDIENYETNCAPADENNVLGHYLNVDFDVSLNLFHILSVSMTASGYSGGAHPYDAATMLNVDLGGSKLMTLGDVLVDDKLKEFFQYEKGHLLTEAKDILYPSSADEFETFVTDAAPMTLEEQQTVYGKFENFYLTPTSLVTYYEDYDIAPYAAGPIRVEMPLTDIASFIDPGEPLYPLLEQVQAAPQQ